MFAPLESVKIPSIYGGALPDRMARCTPDMAAALRHIGAELAARDTKFLLSDLYRSHDMQLQAHLDYVNGKKSAYSPPPGGSMHEAGRAFDMELRELRKLPLSELWTIAEARGVTPIIDTPSLGKSEAWHFDCRGSHGLVYDYYKAGKGDNFPSAYRAMAASAIVSTGQAVDDLGEDPATGYLQSGLIRLGQTIGDLDGRIGPKTRAGLVALGIDPGGRLSDLVEAVEARLQAAFPKEYFLSGVPAASAFAEPATLLSGPSGPPAAGTTGAGYAPSPENRAVLGKIVGLVGKAKPLGQSFVLEPDFAGVLPGGALYFDSRLQLDTDGWPDGEGKGDRWWQAQTSLHYADGKTPIDANKVPYMVLPYSAPWVSDLGIRLGDYAAVVHRGVVAFAVFADGGPNGKLGEGSIQLLRALGEERLRRGRVIDSDAGPGIVTIVFPGSGKAADRADPATLLAAIEKTGRALFATLAG